MRRSQPVLQTCQIAADNGFHIRIERGDHCALVLAEGGIDVARQRHGDARVRRLDQFARALLVRRIQEREQIAHRDRLRAVGDEFRRGTPQRLLIEWHDHLALRGHLLGHRPALRAGCQEHRRDRFQHDAVQILAELVADLDRVAKSFAGDQADLRAFALEHRIGGDRCAVQEARDVACRNAEIACEMADGAQHGLARIAARGGNLQHAHRFAGAAADDVGEGAADIDANVGR